MQNRMEKFEKTSNGMQDDSKVSNGDIRCE